MYGNEYDTENGRHRRTGSSNGCEKRVNHVQTKVILTQVYIGGVTVEGTGGV